MRQVQGGCPEDVQILGKSGRRAKQSTSLRSRPQAARNGLRSQNNALYDRLQPEDGEDSQGAAEPSQANRRPTGIDGDARSRAQHHPHPNCQFRDPSSYQTGSPVAGTDSGSEHGRNGEPTGLGSGRTGGFDNSNRNRSESGHALNTRIS